MGNDTRNVLRTKASTKRDFLSLAGGKYSRSFLLSVALLGVCSLLLFTLFRSGEALAGTAGKVPEKIEVDDVWVGTGIPYEAISVGQIVYLAYFNAAKELTVARVDYQTGEVRKKHLANMFKGWDAHNYVTLSYDKDGFLHVSGNMHDSPLVYARTLRPGDFDSLVLINKMVGSNETSVTYPRFLKFPDGSLGFSYRSGESGNGIELINKFENRRWVRVLSQPLFAPDPSGEAVNAYYTGYILGPDDYFHVAWVWRKKSGADFNFNVNYARSKDLKHWQDSRGNKIDLPMTPSHCEVVDAIPVKGGLLNNIKLGFDYKNRPVISYLKYDEAGNSQLYHARPEDGGWRIVQATDWKYRWVFGSGGTLVKEIAFSGVRARQGHLSEDVSHIKYGASKFIYDPETMEKIADQPSPKKAETPTKEGSAMPLKKMENRIHPFNRDSMSGYVQWYSLGVDNSDRPRTCKSIRQKEGCSMTSTLYLLRSPKE